MNFSSDRDSEREDRQIDPLVEKKKKKKKKSRNKFASVCAPIICGNNRSVHNPVMVHCTAKLMYASNKKKIDRDLIAVHCVLAQ